MGRSPLQIKLNYIMKKIVHIINAMEIGGVEVGVLSLLKSRLSNGYNVVTVKGCDEAIYNSLSESEKSRLHVCNGYFNALRKLIKLKPRIVISSLWRAHFVSVLYMILNPKVRRVHFLHNTGFGHIIDKVLFYISVKMTNLILCDSVQSQNFLKTFNSKVESVVIPMNVSFSNTIKPICFYPINFVFVGRFSKQKAIPKSLEFIKKLNDAGVKVTFDLYGRDDGELQGLKNYVKKNDLCDLITFHHSLLPTQIECEMRRYNYYLQTSVKEGMAISVFQSVKNGLLPVVTPVGEIEKYTRNGFNAFYLDFNNIELSVSKFKEIIENRKIEEFNVGTIVNEINYPLFDQSFFFMLNEAFYVKKS